MTPPETAGSDQQEHPPVTAAACACGERIVPCRDCGDDRCLRCDPYAMDADCDTGLLDKIADWTKEGENAT